MTSSTEHDLKKNPARWMLFAMMSITWIVASQLVGCTNDDDDWYDYSSGMKSDRKGFMESQMEGGMSADQAAKAWESRRSAWETETGGRKGMKELERYREEMGYE